MATIQELEQALIEAEKIEREAHKAFETAYKKRVQIEDEIQVARLAAFNLKRHDKLAVTDEFIHELELRKWDNRGIRLFVEFGYLRVSSFSPDDRTFFVNAGDTGHITGCIPFGVVKGMRAKWLAQQDDE